MEIYDRGLRLRELRKECGFTQEKVAERLGVTRTTVGAYERNEKTPSLEVLERIAVIYHTSVDYILGLDKRKGFFMDELTDTHQKIVLDIVNLLKEEQREKRGERTTHVR